MSRPAPIRILLVGARDWSDKPAIIQALSEVSRDFPTKIPVVLVCGICDLGGAETIATTVWADWVRTWPYQFDEAERYAAKDFPSTTARNQHMIDLGAAVCVAAATRWDGYVGHCARMARHRGIPVVDVGVSTRVEDRPAEVVAA